MKGITLRNLAPWHTWQWVCSYQVDLRKWTSISENCRARFSSLTPPDTPGGTHRRPALEGWAKDQGYRAPLQPWAGFRWDLSFAKDKHPVRAEGRNEVEAIYMSAISTAKHSCGGVCGSDPQVCLKSILEAQPEACFPKTQNNFVNTPTQLNRGAGFLFSGSETWPIGREPKVSLNMSKNIFLCCHDYATPCPMYFSPKK